MGFARCTMTLREMKRPAEIGRILVETNHQEPAECTTGEPDCSRDCDAPSHEQLVVT